MLCGCVLFMVMLAPQLNASARTPVNLVRLSLPPDASGVLANAAKVFTRHVTLRCPARVTLTDAAPLSIMIDLTADTGAEGYEIVDGDDGAIHIRGANARAILYGMGKLLRDAGYSAGGFAPGPWRGAAKPAKPIRGIYFATHFHNFYHDAPVAEIERYVEDLALWGVNTIMVWYDMHHFKGWDDPDAVAFRERIQAICGAASDVGMDVGFGVVVNEGYGDSPVELHADMSGMRGAMMPTDICVSKPEGQAYALRNFAQLFDWAADLHPAYAWIWPYDSGGCGCAGCQPWGHDGFLRAARPLADLIRSKAQGVKIILSTWFLDDKEWAGLAEAFSTPPDWVDYLLAEQQSPAFTKSAPGGLPLVGFPEISMNGMWPWGGFGANPQPAMCAAYWGVAKDKVMGGFPYSEGIYEDINKIILTQLYWAPERSVESILREYIAFEYALDVVDDVLSVIKTLDRNHRFRWWPGMLEDYAGWFPSKGSAPQEDPGAEEAYALARDIDARLAPWAKTAWRWRILYLRALLDSELKTNGGQPTALCEQAFEELTDIHHAENALVDLTPPSLKSMSKRREQVNIINPTVAD